MAYSYKVVEIRDKLMGGNKMSGETLEEVLNQHAQQGWRLKTITATDVRQPASARSRVDGLMITFERES
ncbi:DUF4177 domain-containing protein (plasmid) [Rhodococcus pseudokoreensis]|uniref:DUF4177 domain-containing protein n=1 Tax=Rhodococcus pseudokoreensis TaxID=2811421 RepID=A0A974ZRR1_9NOCA|nr:DUF4177 domain-containing protein [Rhodococcus pseudokoreensis]QSE87925.1 DUF4177 domain-containing protein [Rhodococcus pseudokoreensis]